MTPAWAPSNDEIDEAALQGVSQLALFQSEIADIEKALSAAPLWKPAQGLLAEAAWCRQKIERLSTAWGQKLVIVIVGPSGAGKSTLLNALAGSELSTSGLDRPTTKQVIVYTRQMSDAEELQRHCGYENVRVVTDYHASGLEHLVLVDSPDTNTLAENQRLLSRLLERADLLIPVFPSQNPKMLDNILFLRPFIRQVPADAVIPVLNFADRVPLQELQEVVLPDFRRWIAAEWQLESAPVFVISAKSALSTARFPEDEQPLHAFNQIDALRGFLSERFNQAGQITDRRLAQAEHIIRLLKRDCRTALDRHETAIFEAKSALRALGKQATQLAISMPMRSGLTSEMNTALYANLGQRWWGPVGWLVMLWSLLLRIGSWFSHAIRRTRLTLPLRENQSEQDALILTAERMSTWNVELERLRAERWPPTVDLIIAAGFSQAIRQESTWTEWSRKRGQLLTEYWGLAYHERIERTARKLSFWLWQLLFNAPTLVLFGWLVAQTVSGYLRQQYLPLNYFRHAGITIGVVWLSSFMLLQIITALAVRGSLKSSLAQVITQETSSETPLSEQFTALEALADFCREE